jgi:hypothetical protein
MQVHWTREGEREGRNDPPQLQAGVTWERLEVSPAWSPPPPQVAGFQRRRDGTIQVRLAAWSGDSLEYSVDGAGPRRSASPVGLRLRAGGDLRAVTRRGGLSSDTLFWKIPRYP